MAKVTHVKSARRALPQHNINVGDSYYWWSKMVSCERGVKRFSKTMPTRSQLTNSDFLGSLYEIFDTQLPACETPDDLREVASALRELGEEQRGKYDNMPDGLQQGDTGQLLESRADGCDTAADEIETAADNWETKLTDDELTEEDEATYNEAVAAYKQLEDEEPDEADFEDADEYADEHATWQGKFDDAEEIDEKDFAALREEAKDEAISEAADTESQCEGG